MKTQTPEELDSTLMHTTEEIRRYHSYRRLQRILNAGIMSLTFGTTEERENFFALSLMAPEDVQLVLLSLDRLAEKLVSDSAARLGVTLK